MRRTLQLVILLLLALAIKHWEPWQLLPDWRLKDQSLYLAFPEGVTINQQRTFILRHGESLTFPLAPRVQEIKIISFGLADDRLTDASSPGWAYELKILDRNGTVLREAIGRHRSQPIVQGDSALNTIVADMPNSVPMEGRSWKIRTPKDLSANRLVLKGLPMPGIQGVLVKVEVGSLTDDGLRKVRWSRLSPEDRRALAKSTVYPGYLLRPSERELLLRESSQPIGPSGVGGRDYKEVSLYTYLEDTQPPPTEAPLEYPPFLPLKESWNLTFSTQTQHENLKLLTRSKNPDSFDFWQCLQIQDDGSLTPISEGDFGESFDLGSFAGNRILLRGSGPGEVLLANQSRRHIVDAIRPEGLRSSIWPLEENITFPIYAPKGEDIPLRLTVYQSGGFPGSIYWKALGEDQHLLGSGNLTVDELPPSPRFFLSDTDHWTPDFWVRRFMIVDPKIRYLILEGQPNQMVQLHHRLPRWERERDDLASEEDDDDLNWFSLSPGENDERQSSSLIIPSFLTTEPTQRNWSSILPPELPRFEALSLAVEVENSGDQESSLQGENPPTGVLSLKQRTLTKVTLQSEQTGSLSAKLIIFSEKGTRGFRFRKGRKVLIDENLPEGCTVLRLPNWESGVPVEVLWEADDDSKTEVHLDQVVGAGPMRLRTLGVCTSNPLKLTLPPIQSDDGLISARFYRHFPGPGQMRLVWENAKIHKYLFSQEEIETSRIYRVSSSNLVLRPLGGTHPYLYASSSMFFPLGKMTGEDPVKVRLEFLDGQPSFVSLNIGSPSDSSGPQHLEPDHTLKRSVLSITTTDPSFSKGAANSLTALVNKTLEAQKTKSVNWVSPAMNQKVEELFHRLFEGKQVVHSSWNNLGLKADYLEGYGVWLVQDLEPQGRGLFAIRARSPSRLMLQAPHRWKDLKTGDLTNAWFSRHEVAAACWNTAPRWMDIDGQRWHQDHCDRVGSLFNAFGRAFVRAQKGVVLQIHGYDTSSHHRSKGDQHQAILSNGTRLPGPLALNFVEQLTKAFPDRHPALYPRDTRSLGALKNTQGHALRKLGDHFLHLELGLEFRRLALGTSPNHLSTIHQVINKAISSGETSQR